MSEIREIPLTQGKVAIVDVADSAWLSAFKWRAIPSTKGWRAVRSEGGRKNRKTIYMHRQILGFPLNKEVDHENNNGLDNRRCNLRTATHSQNQCNRGANKNNTLGIKGVRQTRAGRWSARIHIGSKSIHLGTFSDATSAATAYSDAARRHAGEFARTA